MRPSHLSIVLALAVLAAGPAAAQKKEILNPPGTPMTLPFNNGIKIGNQMWVAGVEGDVSGDIEKETRSAFAKIKAILEAGGIALNDIVAVQVYMVNLNEFATMKTN